MVEISLPPFHGRRSSSSSEPDESDPSEFRPPTDLLPSVSPFDLSHEIQSLRTLLSFHLKRFLNNKSPKAESIRIERIVLSISQTCLRLASVSDRQTHILLENELPLIFTEIMLDIIHNIDNSPLSEDNKIICRSELLTAFDNSKWKPELKHTDFYTR